MLIENLVILNFLMENSALLRCLLEGYRLVRPLIDTFSLTPCLAEPIFTAAMIVMFRTITRIPEFTKRVGFKSNAFQVALIFDEVFFAC